MKIILHFDTLEEMVEHCHQIANAIPRTKPPTKIPELRNDSMKSAVEMWIEQIMDVDSESESEDTEEIVKKPNLTIVESQPQRVPPKFISDYPSKRTPYFDILCRNPDYKGLGRLQRRVLNNMLIWQPYTLVNMFNILEDQRPAYRTETQWLKELPALLRGLVWRGLVMKVDKGYQVGNHVADKEVYVRMRSPRRDPLPDIKGYKPKDDKTSEQNVDWAWEQELGTTQKLILQKMCAGTIYSEKQILKMVPEAQTVAQVKRIMHQLYTRRLVVFGKYTKPSVNKNPSSIWIKLHNKNKGNK